MTGEMAGRIWRAIAYLAIGVALGAAMTVDSSEVPPVEFEVGFQIVEPCVEHGDHISTVVDTAVVRMYEITDGTHFATMSEGDINSVLTMIEFKRDLQELYESGK